MNPLNIITVSSDNFFLGTEALHKSILKFNPHRAFNFIVIDAGLNTSQAKTLSNKYNATIQRPNQELRLAINHLCNTIPSLKNRSARFFSLELFFIDLSGTSIFIDSDIICCGEIPLDEITMDFQACYDARSLLGFFRDKETFEYLSDKQLLTSQPERFIDKLFNTGVMIFPEGYLNPKYQEYILKLINAKSFQAIKTGHTDTVVLNRLLLNQVKWLDQKWNTYAFLWDRGLINIKNPIFVHYLGKEKPWQSCDLDASKPSIQRWMEITE